MLSKIRKILKVLPQFFTVLGAVSVAFAMLLSMVNIPVQAGNEDCPGGWVYKINVGGGEEGTLPEGLEINIEGTTVTFNQTVNFCVKAANDNSGIIVGDSYTVDFTNEGGQFPNISHVVVYFGGNTPTETNTPIPDVPTATPTATDVVVPTATPTATDVVIPTATPTATDVVDPTATPTATDVIDPTATPTATDVVDPTATPTDVIDPTATNTPLPDDPSPTPEDPGQTPTNTPIPDISTPTPGDPGLTATPGDPDPFTTPNVDETPDPTDAPTLAPPPPPSNDQPTFLIPVTGSEIDGNSPLDKVQSLMFNLGLSFLGLGLVLQSIRKKINL